MKTNVTAIMTCACLVGCLTTSCSSAKQSKSGPDSAIQDQMTQAGLALINTPGDTTKNYFKDLKGDKVPPEVKTLEKMLGEDRTKALQQLVYYIMCT
jgi:hypothetical protein